MNQTRARFCRPVQAALLAVALIAAPACRRDEAPATTEAPQPQPAVATPARTPAPQQPLRKDMPPVVLEPAVLDLGLLAEGESATGTVQIRNAGTEPLTILRTHASCACTYAQDLSGRILEPGATVPLTATLEPKAGIGRKQEQIRVYIVGYEQYPELNVTAEVALAIRAVPPALEAYKVGLQGQIEVQSLDGQPFRVLGAGGRAPQFVGFDPRTDSPRPRYRLRWDLSGYTAANMPWWWVIETDRAAAPLVDVRVQHEWTRVGRGPHRWVRGDLRILGGVLRPGDTFQFKTKLQYNPRSQPDPGPPTVRATTPGIRAELISSTITGSDIHCRVRVTVLRTEPGLLYESIDFTAGGHTQPVVFLARLER